MIRTCFSALLSISCAVPAIAAQRCDLLIASTPLPGGNAACLDLPALKATPGASIRTAGNATRIARDGVVLCKNAFQVNSGAEADVVFIYDNSGSMTAKYAFADPARADTAFYFDLGGCLSPDTLGNLALQTREGPRTLPLLVSDAGCSDRAGDPYRARAAAMRQGIDFLGKTSPNSTAGAVAFNDQLAHAQPPLPLGTPAALAQVKNSLVLDTAGGTRYGPPLRQATLWLTDTALTRTAKQAVVFISDGAPTDTIGAGSYVNSIYAAIPIFGIFLGDTNAQYGKLSDLSARTGGKFHRVDPGNVGRMNEVMEEIIRAITVTAVPRSIRIVNASLAPAQASVSVKLAPASVGGDIHVTLDSILALKHGANSLSVEIDRGGGTAETFAFQVQADGPEAAQSGPGLACHDQPSLAMLNASGRPDSAYAAGPAAYDILLTRSPSELGTVSVAATARDSSRKSKGDLETLALPMTGRAAGGVSHRRNALPTHGSALAPAPGNGILEGVSGGEYILTWAHPRDSREAASFILPGARIPTLPGFIAVERVRPVTRGPDIRVRIADPVVIRGGAILDRIGPDSAVVTTRGCLYNCTGETVRIADPSRTPSFIFKTASPFAFTLHVYDNLGHVVLKASGDVKAPEWEGMPKIGDSVAVAMSIVPVTADGQPAATGAYILRATISAAGLERNGAAGPSRVTASTRTFVARFGHIRASRPL